MSSEGCVRCGKPVRFSRLCGDCKPVLAQVKLRAVPAARQMLACPGPFTPAWDTMLADLRNNGFPPNVVLADIEKPALAWLARFVAFVASDGVLTMDERQSFYAAAQRLTLPPEKVQALRATVERTYALTEIRAGRLQPLQVPDLRLPIDEHCYYVTPTTRWRHMRSGVQSAPGRLALTSKSILFVAPSMGGQLPWKKVARLVQVGPDQVTVEASAQTLVGAFSVPDVEWVMEMAWTLIKIDRRQILDGAPIGRTAVPQHIKAEVWARDRGACAECGMDGSGGASLEFDHIIPVALGGATSVANLQVLCRQCNLKKGARI